MKKWSDDQWLFAKIAIVFIALILIGWYMGVPPR